MNKFINHINPKLVITFIDNNPRFGRLSSKFHWSDLLQFKMDVD